MTHAVAGARKTQSIIDACKNGMPGCRRLIITFTLSGQRDLERRLNAECAPENRPDVLGWYAFLMQHWVRPFLPLMYPGRRLKGLNFEGSPAVNKQGYVSAKGEKRFLDSNSRAYKMFLSKLAMDVATAAQGSVIERLQRLYGEIYIDEVQDLTGSDLDVVELLLKSTIQVHLVGDVRQSLISTNINDKRLPRFRGLGKLQWFDELSDRGLLAVRHVSTTWRCNQPIATFSDSIFGSATGFPPTESLQTAESDHDGVFAISIDDLNEYLRVFQPVCLRQSIATKISTGAIAVNFGLAKGLTYKRVLVFPTKPMKDFLIKKTPLAPISAFGLYVAVTRAVYSVAFVLDKPEKTSLNIWRPDNQLMFTIAAPERSPTDLVSATVR
ncbi:UvrD-helicase domain-containing protein [Nocardia salmonicida]|uniref:UvrD-helicase domain-containing protein n=1 Tax=Nocardia salmonicida TaxID=53431 RepID=UPI0020D275C2|nr:UvrD-helicase domain-containing protein [Nocardia salmonicida]